MSDVDRYNNLFTASERGRELSGYVTECARIVRLLCHAARNYSRDILYRVLNDADVVVDAFGV